MIAARSTVQSANPGVTHLLWWVCLCCIYSILVLVIIQLGLLNYNLARLKHSEKQNNYVYHSKQLAVKGPVTRNLIISLSLFMGVFYYNLGCQRTTYNTQLQQAQAYFTHAKQLHSKLDPRLTTDKQIARIVGDPGLGPTATQAQRLKQQWTAYATAMEKHLLIQEAVLCSVVLLWCMFLVAYTYYTLMTVKLKSYVQAKNLNARVDYRHKTQWAQTLGLTQLVPPV